MEIVVDVNVILSSLWKRGNSLKVFELNLIYNKFDFIAPEFLLKELERHKTRLSDKSKLSKGEFNEVLEFILGQITFIPKAEFSDFIPKAERILHNHQKDIPYLALALKLNCPILSGDKVFRAICPEKVISPKEILDKF